MNQNFAKGIEMAKYQTAGLVSETEIEVVKAWRRKAMDQGRKVRVQGKKDVLAGFVRGCSDWIASVEGVL